MPVLPSYRNQSIDLLCKSIDWFLYEGNTGIQWVKFKFVFGYFAVAHQWKSEVYPDPSWTSKIGLFAKIINGFQPLTIFAKSSILDVQLGSEYTSESSVLNLFPIRTAATGLTNLTLYVTMYSIMDYLKFMDHITSNFLKAVFPKF